MTELQWLIKVLTQQKLSNTLKDLFIERIGEVETRLQGVRPVLGPTPQPLSPTGQAPSTQKILDEMALEQNTNPITPQRVIVPRRTQSKEPVVTSVTNGGFTSGPKKW